MLRSSLCTAMAAAPRCAPAFPGPVVRSRCTSPSIRSASSVQFLSLGTIPLRCSRLGAPPCSSSPSSVPTSGFCAAWKATSPLVSSSIVSFFPARFLSTTFFTTLTTLGTLGTQGSPSIRHEILRLYTASVALQGTECKRRIFSPRQQSHSTVRCLSGRAGTPSASAGREVEGSDEPAGKVAQVEKKCSRRKKATLLEDGVAEGSAAAARGSRSKRRSEADSDEDPSRPGLASGSWEKEGGTIDTSAATPSDMSALAAEPAMPSRRASDLGSISAAEKSKALSVPTSRTKASRKVAVKSVAHSAWPSSMEEGDSQSLDVPVSEAENGLSSGKPVKQRAQARKASRKVDVTKSASVAEGHTQPLDAPSAEALRSQTLTKPGAQSDPAGKVLPEADDVALVTPSTSVPPSAPDGGVVEVLAPEEVAFAAPVRRGAIHIILGPMFSGKTTELLRRVAEEKAQGKNVLLVKSSVDTRYATNEVVSHAGQRMKCVAVASLADIPRVLGHSAFRDVEVIAVDEAQFIQDVDLFAERESDQHHRTVILAGLDGDFLRRKFGGLVDLIPLADTVTKLQARCQVCGEGAMFTLRKSGDLRKELVGGADLYMPVCRHHYLAGKSLVTSILQDSDSAMEPVASCVADPVDTKKMA